MASSRTSPPARIAATGSKKFPVANVHVQPFELRSGWNPALLLGCRHKTFATHVADFTRKRDEQLATPVTTITSIRLDEIDREALRKLRRWGKRTSNSEVIREAIHRLLYLEMGEEEFSGTI